MKSNPRWTLSTITGVVATALTFTLATAGSAHAADEEPLPGPEPTATCEVDSPNVPAGEVCPVEAETTASVFTYTDYAEDGTRRLLSKKSLSDTTMAESEGMLFSGGDGTTSFADPDPDASGGSTASSASGCRRVTITNTYRSTLGFVGFRFKTYTEWCWTRANKTVHHVTYGWDLYDVDAVYNWIGFTKNDRFFYDYGANDGYPRSAFKHHKIGKLQNCVLKYGCIGHAYPNNKILSYYNGSWSWTKTF